MAATTASPISDAPPLAVLEVDISTGAIIHASELAENLTGIERSQLIGRDYRELIRTADPMDDIARHLGAGDLREQMIPAAVVRPDGSAIPVVGLFAAVGHPPNFRVILVLARTQPPAGEAGDKSSGLSWALSMLSAAIAGGIKSRTAADLAQTVCESIVRLDAFPLAWVGLAGEGRTKPVVRLAAAGRHLDYLDGIAVSWSPLDPKGQGPAGRCIRTGVAQVMTAMETDQHFRPWAERASKHGLCACFSAPIVVDAKVVGALMVYSGVADDFDGMQRVILQHLASQLGAGMRTLEMEADLAVERRRNEDAQALIRQSLEATIKALVDAMQARDPYTAGHDSRVATIAVAIARELGWDPKRIDGLHLAALIHDIGKIAVPAEILTKPGKLNAAEYALVKEHPETGYEILKGIPFPWPIATIVRQHHERIDGSGYPNGLVGDAIVPEARVLAVADTMESMLSHHPYRPAMSLDTALTELHGRSGSTLDRDAATACRTLFLNGRLPGELRKIR